MEEAEVRVKLNIKIGAASPAQKKAWQRFWQKIIAEAKAEVGIGNSVPRAVECGQIELPSKGDG